MNYSFRIALLLISFGFNTSFSQFIIKGKVKDLDGKYLANVNITIENTNLGASSDANGIFTIENIPSGEHNVKASCTGYLSLIKKIIPEDSITYLDFSLKESLINLDEIVITATRTEKLLKNTPALTEIISSKELEQIDAVTSLEALDMISPGIDFNKDMHGAGMKLNGLSNKWVLILIDGERMAGSTKGNLNFSRLNTDNIKKIEIVKGAYSTLYGSNAVGGIINIITEDVNDSLEIGIKSRISDYNEIKLNSHASIKFNKINSRISITRKSMGEYDLDPENQALFTQKKFNDLSINQKINYKPLTNLDFQFNGAFFQYERFNPVSKEYTIIDATHPIEKNYTLGIKSKYNLNQDNSVEVSYHHDRYEIFEIKDARNAPINLINKDLTTNITILGNFKLKNHLLTIGNEYNKEHLFSNRTISNNAFNDYILFVQDEIHVSKKFTSVLGSRLNHHTEYGYHLTPKISIMYKILSITIRSNYGLGYRSPSLKEKYFDFDHGGLFYIKGDKNLVPEESEYKSISIEYTKSTINTSITLYRNDLKNMIDYDWAINADTVYTTNIKRASVQGFDFSIKTKITNSFSFNASYSFLDTENKETKQELENVSKNLGKFAVNYKFQNSKYHLNINLQGKIVGEKKITDYIVINSQDIAQYITSSPFSIFKITTIHSFSYLKNYNLSIGLGIDNIFNYIDRKTYAYTTNSPGRRFFASLKMVFKK